MLLRLLNPALTYMYLDSLFKFIPEHTKEYISNKTYSPPIMVNGVKTPIIEKKYPGWQIFHLTQLQLTRLYQALYYVFYGRNYCL